MLHKLGDLAMRRGLWLSWLIVGAGCTFNPAAAHNALMQGDMKLLQKDYVAAIGLYDQALANDPTLREAYLQRGIAFRRNGDYDRAMADINMAIERGLDGSRVYAERARTKLERLAVEASGDKDKLAAAFAKEDPLGIAADLDRAAQLDRLNQDTNALLLHAALRIMQGRDAEAQKDFDRYLLHRPGARADLEDAVKKWKQDRPALDLVPIDDLGRMPAHRLSRTA
jgi:tetratricopeptide (TPR) repeat protein